MSVAPWGLRCRKKTIEQYFPSKVVAHVPEAMCEAGVLRKIRRRRWAKLAPKTLKRENADSFHRGNPAAIMVANRSLSWRVVLIRSHAVERIVRLICDTRRLTLKTASPGSGDWLVLMFLRNFGCRRFHLTSHNCSDLRLRRNGTSFIHRRFRLFPSVRS